MLLEQAESKFTHGPVRLKNQLSRAASMATAIQVALYVGSMSGSLKIPNLQSSAKQPV